MLQGVRNEKRGVKNGVELEIVRWRDTMRE